MLCFFVCFWLTFVVTFWCDPTPEGLWGAEHLMHATLPPPGDEGESGGNERKNNLHSNQQVTKPTLTA